MKLILLLPILTLSQDSFTTVYNVSQKLVNRELGSGSDLEQQSVDYTYIDIYMYN